VLEAMGFSPWRQVHGRASIEAFFMPRRRCGIYVLRFSNEEFYVGKAVDVTRRYAQHRKTYADIEQMAFKQVPRSKLDEEEQSLTGAWSRQGGRCHKRYATSAARSGTGLATR
jgi:hypothetical protein